ncbi:Type III secretion apparatus [Erwinia sp. Ejp617]|nr:HrpJ domain-containing protein [Erwinia sp. Ejp617]ADP12407.1 Type III secretion apparatus [Erwinia sp. Ejp617]
MEIRRSYQQGSLPPTMDGQDESYSDFTGKSFSKSESTDQNEILSNIAEELADTVSTFGRTSKFGRKNDSFDNDTVSAILEENAEEKIFILIKQITKFQGQTSILNYARQFFPNEWDLFQALREILLRRKLSEIQKKKVREALLDLERFGDQKKIKSSINVTSLARRFSKSRNGNKITAKELRNSYLRFLELEVPATYIYNDWIDEFGFKNRRRLLLFTRSALIADMKASEPGVHLHEFGPISDRISDARILHTLDLNLTGSFKDFAFGSLTGYSKVPFSEEHILTLFLTGLIDCDALGQVYDKFKNDFMSEMTVNRQAIVVQMIRNVYNLTPDFLYANLGYQEATIDFLNEVLYSLHSKERNVFTYDSCFRQKNIQTHLTFNHW